MTADMIKGIRMELMADKRLLGRLKTLRKHYQEKRDRAVEQRRERIKQLLGDYPTERQRKIHKKIDGAVATIMVLDRAIRCGSDTSASVYDDRGILFYLISEYFPLKVQYY